MIDNSLRRRMNKFVDSAYRWAKTALGDPPGTIIAAHEVDSVYMGQWEPDKNVRFIVSLIVGYDPETEKTVTTPGDAAAATLDLIRAVSAGGVQWCVFDRLEGRMYRLSQSTFDAELSVDAQERQEAERMVREGVERFALETLIALADQVIEAANGTWGEGSLALTKGWVVEEALGTAKGAVELRRAYLTARAALEGLGFDAFDAKVAAILKERREMSALLRDAT